MMIIHNLVNGLDRLAKRIVMDQIQKDNPDSWYGETKERLKS